MGQITAIIGALGTILPILHELILFVERIYPKATPGAEKLNAVLNIIEGILPQVGTAGNYVQTILGIFKPLVNVAVAGMNAGNVLANTASVHDTLQQSEGVQVTDLSADMSKSVLKG